MWIMESPSPVTAGDIQNHDKLFRRAMTSRESMWGLKSKKSERSWIYVSVSRYPCLWYTAYTVLMMTHNLDAHN